MEHSEAVRIANSGQGAVVSELIRISEENRQLKERIKNLLSIIDELEESEG